MPDVLVLLALFSLLLAILIPIIGGGQAKSRQTQCMANLKQITKAVLMYTEENQGNFPMKDQTPPTGLSFWYKEQVKAYVGLKDKSSPNDKLFACPADRGYTDPIPFWRDARFDFNSYAYNGIVMPGIPSLAGQKITAVKDTRRTILVMEWCAHAPISWHKSRTGKHNLPFYNGAESMVGFVDGSVKFIPIYYDGINPAFSREPISGFDYHLGVD